MAEPIENIRSVCPEHGPKPIDYKGKLEDLIGKHVKKAFTTIGQGGRLEHMWVEVTHIDRGVIVGTLDNEPVLATYIKDGDEVRLLRSEIEQIM